MTTSPPSPSPLVLRELIFGALELVDQVKQALELMDPPGDADKARSADFNRQRDDYDPADEHRFYFEQAIDEISQAFDWLVGTGSDLTVMCSGLLGSDTDLPDIDWKAICGDARPFAEALSASPSKHAG